MTQKPSQFHVKVVPLTRIPLRRGQSFSYLHDAALSFGTLVQVPIGYRRVQGIVISCTKGLQRLGGMRLKRVSAVLQESFMTEQQMALAEQISEMTFCPLGIVLKHFTPRPTQKRAPKDAEIKEPQAASKLPSLSTKEKATVSKITKTLTKEQTLFLHTPPGSQKLPVLLEVMKAPISKKKQVLYLVPELSMVPHIFATLTQAFPATSIVVLHSKLSKGAFYESWQEIADGSAQVIVGTRAALFAPFADLGLIIMDEAHDVAYKQWDMNPRYNSRSIVEAMRTLYNCPTLFTTATPSVVDYCAGTDCEAASTATTKSKAAKSTEASKALKNTLNIPFLTLPITAKRPHVAVVNMKKERWEKRYSPISQALRDTIASTLGRKKQVILFVNHQGMNAFSVCTQCKAPMKCPECTRALVETAHGAFRCLHCSYATDVFPACLSCGSITFRSVGIGTQKIEKEVSKLFPRATVVRADARSMQRAGARETLYADFSSGAIDILIGTQMITKGWESAHIGCAAVIDADMLFSIPDYASDERAFAHIVNVSDRVKDSHGTVVIQAFGNERKTLLQAVEQDFQGFYAAQYAERKTLHYPPFTRLIKLTYQSKEANKVEKVATEAAEELQELFANARSVDVSDAHAPLLDKVRARYRQQIVIKLKGQKIPVKLYHFLRQRDGNWIIDVDPVSLV